MFLEIKNLCKSFGEGDNRIQVLKGLDMAVEKGAFLVLLGPSGSGKSTLLNIIGGMITGWIAFYLDPLLLVKMFVMGVGCYLVVVLPECRSIHRVPMDMALKNVE